MSVERIPFNTILNLCNSSVWIVALYLCLNSQQINAENVSKKRNILTKKKNYDRIPLKETSFTWTEIKDWSVGFIDEKFINVHVEMLVCHFGRWNKKECLASREWDILLFE